MSPRKTRDNPLGLDPVEGEPVTELGIEIPGAAGGFRKPLDVDERLLSVLAPVTKGDVVFAVLQLVKRDFKMKSATNHDGWKRVDIFNVTGAAIVDADFALSAVEEQRERVQEAIDAAAAQSSMVDGKGKEKPEAVHGEGDPEA